MDDTSDISNREQSAIPIRLIYDGNIEEHLLGLIDSSSDQSAEGLTKVLLDTLDVSLCISCFIENQGSGFSGIVDQVVSFFRSSPKRTCRLVLYEISNGGTEITDTQDTARGLIAGIQSVDVFLAELDFEEVWADTLKADPNFPARCAEEESRNMCFTSKAENERQESGIDTEGLDQFELQHRTAEDKTIKEGVPNMQVPLTVIKNTGLADALPPWHDTCRNCISNTTNKRPL
eukprot:gene1770-1972_t